MGHLAHANTSAVVETDRGARQLARLESDPERTRTCQPESGSTTLWPIIRPPSSVRAVCAAVVVVVVVVMVVVVVHVRVVVVRVGLCPGPVRVVVPSSSSVCVGQSADVGVDDVSCRGGRMGGRTHLGCLRPSPRSSSADHLVRSSSSSSVTVDEPSASAVHKRGEVTHLGVHPGSPSSPGPASPSSVVSLSESRVRPDRPHRSGHRN